MFVPGSGAWQGLQRGKVQKIHILEKKLSQERKEKVYRNTHAGLGRQLQEAESILAKEDNDIPIESSPPCAKNCLLKITQKLCYFLVLV